MSDHSPEPAGLAASRTAEDLLLHSRGAVEMWKGMEKKIELRVRGGSMGALMREGDRLALRLMSPEKLRVGDVFAFWEKGAVVAHRLIRKKRVDGALWLCEKGDNTLRWSWLPAERVLGRVDLVRTSGRTLDLNGRPWSAINPMLAWTALVLIAIKGSAPGSQEARPAGWTTWFLMERLRDLQDRLVKLLIALPTHGQSS